MVLLCFKCHCNRSKIILVEIFREIVVEKIMQPKNDSQTQWLIPICHVSTRTWLLVLSMFHRLTCLSTYLETLTVISSTAMVYPQSPSIASNDFSIYYSFLRPQLQSESTSSHSDTKQVQEDKVLYSSINDHDLVYVTLRLKKPRTKPVFITATSSFQRKVKCCE